MKRLPLALLVLGSLTFAPAVLANHTPIRFVGLWTAIDCPSVGGAPADCSLNWLDADGNPTITPDGSAMTLKIERGETPRVTYADSYASFCDNNGSPSTRWVAIGTGEYVDSNGNPAPPFVTLWANFTKSGCGQFAQGGYSLQYYLDPGSDMIWEDSDGDNYGTVWSRAH
jgi:hypothetical protein